MKVASFILFLVTYAVLAGQIEIDFSLSASEVLMSEYQGRDLVRFEGGHVCFGDGYPNLPGTTYACVIPQGTSIIDIEVIVEGIVTLDGSFRIDPVRVLPLGDVPGQHVDAQYIWMSNDQFPASQVTSINNGNKTGYRIGSFSFVPFRYHPTSGELTLITSAKLVVTYETDPEIPLLCLTTEQVSAARQTLETWIHNPEMLDAWTPTVRAARAGDTEWVAIAADHYLYYLEELVTHRQNLGVTSASVSIEWICNNYTGYDTQEKIRNYLKDAYENRGTVFVLLVGEYNQPLETVRISEIVQYGYSFNNITDLYYSDLDGT